MPALQSCGTVCTYACPCGARKSVFYRIWLSMTGFSITIGDEHFASHTLIISYLTALACDSEASDSSDWQCTLRFIVLMSCNRLQSPAAGKKNIVTVDDVRFGIPSRTFRSHHRKWRHSRRRKHGHTRQSRQRRRGTPVVASAPQQNVTSCRKTFL